MSELAAAQLAAWEAIADDWPEYADGEGVRRCVECGLGIYLELDSSGRMFQYTHAQVLSLTVLHLRNHHADLDPDG